MEHLFTATEACNMLDMPRNSLQEWLRHGAVEPVIPAAGRGSPLIMNVQQCWALGIARSIRNGGQSLTIAVKVAKRLDTFDPDYVEKSFRKGRTCIVVITAGEQQDVVKELVHPDEILNNKSLNKLRAQAKKEGRVLMFSGIDVKGMLDQLVTLAEKQAKERKKKSKEPKKKR